MSQRRWEVRLAWGMLVCSILGWPVSALTALDFLKTSRVHRDQDDGGGDA